MLSVRQEKQPPPLGFMVGFCLQPSWRFWSLGDVLCDVRLPCPPVGETMMCSRPIVPLPCGRSLRTPSSSNHQETEPRPFSSCFAAPSVSAAWCSCELSSEVVSEAAARSLGTWRGCTHCSPGEKGPGPKEGVLSALSCASLREGRQGNRTCSTYPFEGGSSLFSAHGGVAAH